MGRAFLAAVAVGGLALFPGAKIVSLVLLPFGVMAVPQAIVLKPPDPSESRPRRRLT